MFSGHEKGTSLIFGQNKHKRGIIERCTLFRSGAISVSEGQLYGITPSVTRSSSEPDSDTIPSCTINWGDGTNPPPATPRPQVQRR